MKSNENCHTYVANVLLLLTMLPPWVLMTTGFSFWWHTTFTSHHRPSVKWAAEMGWMFCVCAFVSKKALLRPSAMKILSDSRSDVVWMSCVPGSEGSLVLPRRGNAGLSTAGFYQYCHSSPLSWPSPANVQRISVLWIMWKTKGNKQRTPQLQKSIHSSQTPTPFPVTNHKCVLCSAGPTDLKRMDEVLRLIQWVKGCLTVTINVVSGVFKCLYCASALYKKVVKTTKTFIRLK